MENQDGSVSSRGGVDYNSDTFCTVHGRVYFFLGSSNVQPAEFGAHRQWLLLRRISGLAHSWVVGISVVFRVWTFADDAGSYLLLGHIFDRYVRRNL
jgi:hypothetical protein